MCSAITRENDFFKKIQSSFHEKSLLDLQILKLVRDCSPKHKSKKDQNKDKSLSSDQSDKNKKITKILFSINEILNLPNDQLNGKIFAFNQDLKFEDQQSMNDKEGEIRKKINFTEIIKKIFK